MDTSPGHCKVGTLSFEVTTLGHAVEQTLDDAFSGRRVHVHLANAWSIVLADDDYDLREAFRSGRNYPDGKPVVWAMQCLGGASPAAHPERVYGPTFFERSIEKGIDRRVRHYFLGGTPQTLEKLKYNLRARFREVNIVGVSSPPFKDLTSDELAYELAKIEASKPDIVWVGLGTPKQDKVAAYLSSKYSAVFACVGAAFDFSAGNLREVPLWVQEAGLAWLFRFIQEPKRLWRRYTYGNVKFMVIVSRQLTKLVRRRLSAGTRGC